MPTQYCRHVRPNGTRCRSLALLGQLRCFWHTGLQQRHALPAPPHIPPEHADPAFLAAHPLAAQYYAPQPLELDFPELEDRASIQLALSMLLGALARNRIDPKRAHPILYGLKLAGANVRDLPGAESYVVRSPVLDGNGRPLAPDEDPEEVLQAQRFLEDYEEDQRKLEEDDDYESPYAED